MTTFTIQPQDQSAPNWAPQLSRMWQTSRTLCIAIIFFAITIPFSMVMAGIDSSEIDNARSWFKPIKFSVSALLYCFTFLWMLSLTTKWQRVTRIVGGLVALNLGYDIVWVVVQALRGVRSHYNTTPLDAALYGLAGAAASIVLLCNIVIIAIVLAHRFEDKTLKWALIMGMVATTIGGFMGPFMSAPSATQLAALQAGETPEVLGAHSVGVEDGGAGLPFLGWSTEGGDMRVAHFTGLHGLQAIPLLGVFINRLWGSTLSNKKRSGLIIVAGLGYAGMTLLLMWQAMRGQSVIAPDATTLAAFAGLFVTVAGIATLIVKSGTQHHPAIPAQA